MAGRKPFKNTRAQNTEMQSLPKEITFAIFLLLPAKVLAVIKFFCKEWYRVISDPAFVRDHLLRTKPRLVFQTGSDILSLEVNRGARNRVTLLSTRQYGGEKLYIRASCDGLLLLENSASVDRSLVVTNPITGQWSQLPIPRPESDRQFASWLYFYGFAYDRLSKYKLVRLFREHKEALAVCEVLTLGSDSWREVNGPPVLSKDHFTIIHNSPISVDGVVYWVNPVCAYILSFDVGYEEFSYTPCPPEAKGECHPLDMGGKLSLVSWTDTQLDIWILEDRRRVVWMKSTTMMDLVNGWKYERAWISPIACLDDGEVLIFRDSFNLFSFDLKHNKCEEIKTHLRYLKLKLKRAYDRYLDRFPFPLDDSLVNWET